MKSKIYSRISVLVILLISQFSNSQNPPQNVIDEIQSILDNQRMLQLSPASVLSIHKVGEWNYTWASGVRDIITNEPATGIERFRVGSVTKNFTATCILKLASQGILSLDDPISMWLSPEIMNTIQNGDLMTIRNLLNHTSGMADYINDPNATLVADFINNPFIQVSINDIMSTYFAPLTPVSLPSISTFNYTNTGFALLGTIVQNASGLTYKEYVEQNITNPLNLSNTSLPSLGEYDISGIHLKGYYTSETELYNDITEENTSWANSAGEIISSTGDLNIYFKNLLEGNIIPASFVNMMTDFTSTDAGYGLGCYEFDLDGSNWFGHNGGIPGYGTNMYHNAATNTYVSNNFNYEDADINAILLDLNTYLNNLLAVENNTTNPKSNIVYPNPALNYIKIDTVTETENLEIIISDVTGKSLITIKNYKKNTPIDVTILQKGLYFINSSNKIIESQKFIKE